jgi:hypothetical protein
MRLGHGLLVGLALLSTGCSVYMAQSGEDVTQLANRELVHEDFGLPTTSGMIDGMPYDEFQTQRKISEWQRASRYDAEDALTLGLAEFIASPIELNRNGQRLILGHLVRFYYDESGHVVNVYLNGELLLPPTKTPIVTPETTAVDKQP